MQPELYGVPVALLIVGVVEAFKKSGLPAQWAPLISLALGVLAGVALIYTAVPAGVPLTGPNVVKGIVVGISIGLGAVGTYSTIDHFSSTTPTPPVVSGGSPGVTGATPVTVPPEPST